MPPQQITIFVILAVMLVLFLWDRLRYDLVAVLALLAAVMTGVVPAKDAFRGFSNEVIPLIAGALIVSAAIGRSGLVEAAIRRLAPLLGTPDLQVGALVAIVTVLSAFMKNIGALAIFVPIAIQMARRAGRSPSEMLMPLSFGSLIGGLATLIGTSPNILISGQRAQLSGKPFEMFDFTAVGGTIALCGIGFLAFGWRLLPRGIVPPPAPESLFNIDAYTSELRIPEGSPVVGETVADLERRAEGELRVKAVIRGEWRRNLHDPGLVLRAGDLLMVESDPHRLDSVVAEARLELAASTELPADKAEAAPRRREAAGTDRFAVVEAVIALNSPMVGLSPVELRLRRRYGVNLLAVSRSGHATGPRLHRTRLRSGDVVVLQGVGANLPETLASLGCLPLAERKLQLGRPRQIFLPALILAGAMIAATIEIVPASIAFIAAAALIALFRILSLKEIYDSVEWPILVLLGALIPVGEAVQRTGATERIAEALAFAAGNLPPIGLLGIVMIITMLLTPILHHAAAVIVMGPVAASLAGHAGFSIDPFLMAVAVGAGSDFLSPIGHQCNTLVLGPGGYRFADYWRLGLPLSVIVVVVGLPLILLFWPLH